MTLNRLLPLALLALALAACGPGNAANGPIEGSGYVSSRQVNIAAEMSGTVLDVAVEEGDSVKAGDVLVQLDREYIEAQYQQAEAAVQAAQAQLAAAQVQLEMALQGAQMQSAAQGGGWQQPAPDGFSLPSWYFQKSEAVGAAQAEVAAAEEALDKEQDKLADLLEDSRNRELLDAEQALLDARAALLVAQTTREQARSARDNGAVLEAIAQQELDAAENRLSQAQLDYDRLLSGSQADDLLEARGRVAIAQARYEQALNQLTLLQTGDQSLQVIAARSVVEQAEAGLAQAEAVLTLADVQLTRTTLVAPNDGVVLARNLEEGELIAAGSTLLVLGQVDPVELVIYVPEDRYGQIQLGQQANVSVDSFPDEVFVGEVIAIAEEAEFTPRNVQTVDGRKSTVYAVKIRVPNPEGKLKSGMPADALLGE